MPDGTDSRIIGLLRQNADLSYTEMARRLRLNESTLRKRIIALRSKGIIRRRLADVNAERLGYKSRMMLAVDAEPSKLLDVGKRLAAIPQARFVFAMSGESDFLVVIWTRDSDSMAKVVESVGVIEGVVKVTQNFLWDRLK
ncbi:Lrp/AsnC family transcriptional regulator [Candidatus Bathyarchaeota archaeon]|nr:MAG: Lrp/AsnC family transcriptional regulator [Candidatus Bathyarchaeota archaeon]